MRKTIIMLASVVCAGALVVQIMFAMAITDTFSKAFAAPVIQASCASYVEFVLARTEEGMSPKNIDKLWNQGVAKHIEPHDRMNSEGICGTVESIVDLAKTK